MLKTPLGSLLGWFSHEAKGFVLLRDKGNGVCGTSL
jgi:hypothetical protein